MTNGPAGIDAITLDGTLRDQVLDFKHVLVKTTTGELDAKINVDARKDPARTKASGKIENVAITRLISTQLPKGSANDTFKLDLVGSSFREAFGWATGEAGLWSNNSEIAKIANEAAGLDVGKVLNPRHGRGEPEERDD